MALESPPINGAEIQRYAVVFGLYPGDPAFHTIVERAPEVAGAPGTAAEVATLAPGVRVFVEEFGSDGSFFYYRFKHRGFAFDAGIPTAWYRARPVLWDGTIPNVPREPLLDLDLALDDATGNVSIAANGGRAVRSIEWQHSTTSFPTDPSTVVNATLEGDVTVTDAFTLTRGQTGYVTVQYFDQQNGGGNLLGTLRQSITYSVSGEADPDTTLGTLVLNGDFEHETDGAYWQNASGSRGSIETASPLSGSKSLKLVSAAGGSTFTNQLVTSAGFGPGTTGGESNIRFIPVAPGDAFEVRCAGQGQSNLEVQFRAATWDADKVQLGSTKIVGFTSGGITAIVAWTVPAGASYVSWQVLVPADASAPRDYFMDDISIRRIDSTVTGIPTELSLGGTYYINESQMTVDSSGGVVGSDPGKVYWGPNNWKYIHPNGSKHFVAFDSVTLVSLDGTHANTAEMMCYVATATARFTDLANVTYRRIVGVRKSRSAGWQYLGDSGWKAFTPNTNDGLLAEPVLTTQVT